MDLAPLRHPSHPEAEWSAEYLHHTGFLLISYVDPEEDGEIFLRNVSYLLTDRMELYPVTQNSFKPPRSIVIYVVSVYRNYSNTLHLKSEFKYLI
jgi:hypothetical protein